MNKRKMHVIDTARELFIKHGYHATSIQDILEASGISKGSFYNYFSSKSELFQSVFSSMFALLRERRDALVVGKDLKNPTIFIEQMVLLMGNNDKIKIQELINDVMISNDLELIAFIKNFRYFMIVWVNERLMDILPSDKKEHSFDVTLQFMGLTHMMFEMNRAVNKKYTNEEMIRYALNQSLLLVQHSDVMATPLFTNQDIADYFPQIEGGIDNKRRLTLVTMNLKKALDTKSNLSEGDNDYLTKMLFFIQKNILDENFSDDFIFESFTLSIEKVLHNKEIEEYCVYRTFLRELLNER